MLYSRTRMATVGVKGLNKTANSTLLHGIKVDVALA